ncbi:hypothetical protein B4144_3796 [Bacillus atrophaeus]|nr:hypothetical protein B4144_3796 [Bacillus atrophaeus]
MRLAACRPTFFFCGYESFYINENAAAIGFIPESVCKSAK